MATTYASSSCRSLVQIYGFLWKLNRLSKNHRTNYCDIVIFCCQLCQLCRHWKLIFSFPVKTSPLGDQSPMDPMAPLWEMTIEQKRPNTNAQKKGAKFSVATTVQFPEA